MTKYYVVWKGHTPGIYYTYEKMLDQITGFNDPIFKSFVDEKTAIKAFKKKSVHKKYDKILCVDAACSGNPGPLEYRGVFTKTEGEFFKVGIFPYGTNNIGEFCAIVHGLIKLKKLNSDMPIYSDSTTAISWVKKKRIKTTLKRNNDTEKLFKLVDYFLNWLKSNYYKNEIRKWNTKLYGEIPADFGRK